MVLVCSKEWTFQFKIPSYHLVLLNVQIDLTHSLTCFISESNQPRNHIRSAACKNIFQTDHFRIVKTFLTPIILNLNAISAVSSTYELGRILTRELLSHCVRVPLRQMSELIHVNCHHSTHMS